MFRFITGDDLRRMRLSCNRSTADMARKIAVSRITYERYETGIEKPEASHVMTLVLYCRISITPLFKQLHGVITHFNQYKDVKNDKAQIYRRSAEKAHRKPEQEES